MATKKVKQLEEVSALGGIQKVKTLKIKNFRAIKEEITIDLDEIVVLIGPNNTGKSSILKAYEMIMRHGSKDCIATIRDFHQESEANVIEITLETYIDANSERAPASKWILTEGSRTFVREKWIWKAVGEPQRIGFNSESKEWDDQVPWGAPGVANSNRPYPHRVDAFENPENQISEIKDIVGSIVKDKIALIKDPNDNSKTAIEVISEKLAEFKRIAAQSTDGEVTEIEDGISKIITEVFPNYELKIIKVPNPDVDLLKGKNSVVSFDSELKFGKKNEGYMSPLANHGSGARRTLLWSALKYIREHNKGKINIPNERSHVLLMDEPEICLHPSAIRYAAQVLYDLPTSGKWQVMLTTHCPLFIDLSRDNTTIVRVDIHETTGNVSGTSLFRPTATNLSDDEKELLKLLNIYDPYFAEFFLAKNILVVEGDTEYSAFKFLGNLNDEFKDLHIIRARSKAGIVAVCKILNQFQAKYSVLHDSDEPMLPSGNVNPAWTVNRNILNEVKKGSDKGCQIGLFASKRNFEAAFLSEEVKKDKPFNAISKLKNDQSLKNSLELALRGIIAGENSSANITKWQDIEVLEAYVRG
jgi:putative ATP-dependent endonuclease of OLD family